MKSAGRSGGLKQITLSTVASEWDSIPTERKPTIWEERILLISAQREAEARDKAEQIGNSSAQTCQVEDGLVSGTSNELSASIP